MALVQITLDQSNKPEKIQSPTGIIFTSSQKVVLMVIAGLFLWLRLYMRKRKKDKICPHCGHRNPPHQTNCINCSAPLFGK